MPAEKKATKKQSENLEQLKTLVDRLSDIEIDGVVYKKALLEISSVFDTYKWDEIPDDKKNDLQKEICIKITKILKKLNLN